MKELRFTTTKPMGIFESLSSDPNNNLLVNPKNKGALIAEKVKGRTAYLHGEAMSLAGFDIPVFIDGNPSQLDLPVEQQKLTLLLPSGEYGCKAEFIDGDNSKKYGAYNCYLITLLTEPSVL